jgi:DNA-directed RNA polymerase specialized sigma24 family protein
VYREFQRLSAAQRSCIWLKDVEHFSYQEIAEILGIINIRAGGKSFASRQTE